MVGLQTGEKTTGKHKSETSTPGFDVSMDISDKDREGKDLEAAVMETSTDRAI